MNKLYIITYDLSNPGRNYEPLLKGIKANVGWAKLGGSAYLVQSPNTEKQLRDSLLQFLDRNDKLYVSLIGTSAAWYGLPDDVATWIVNNQK